MRTRERVHRVLPLVALANRKHAAVVPGAPPQNVTGEAVSPTSIQVNWEPPRERSSGKIIYYKLHFVEADRSDSEASVNKLNATSFVLDELKRWTQYRIWVLAGTSVGDGPASFPITVRTHEDGTLNSKTLQTNPFMILFSFIF